jgi:CRISPR-associated protein Cmr4
MMRRVQRGILTLYAETALHVGVGQRTGPIDLPIERERHTGIPLIPGHGLKGALRALAGLRDGPRNAGVEEVFGPEVEDGDLRQGSLIVHDALPLAVPFRALQGLFVWTTCPLLLERLHARTGRPVQVSGQVSEGRALVPRGNGFAPPLVIEDLDFEIDELDPVDLTWCLPAPVRDVRSRRLEGRLVVLDDDDFGYLVRHCLPVVARVQLTERKTVANLWSEERLPPDTIMYSPLEAVSRPHTANPADPPDPLGYVKGLIEWRPVLQVGGNETVGMGWYWAGFVPPGGGGPEGDP